MTGKHIVIAGGSGFIGMQMAVRWAKDNKVTILTRSTGAANNSYGSTANTTDVNMVKWDGKTIGDWVTSLEGCDLLINLAGRTVNCRYNEQNKAEVMNSRIDATRVLGAAVKQLLQPPALWINGGSTTIYRHAEDRPQDEFTGERPDDFSVQVCKRWEETFNEITLPHTRKAILRIAIVLGKGGVLVPYSRLARLGIGGRQGYGKQMFSWIHMEDLCMIVEWLYEHKEQTGTYNAAAPNPIPNATFMNAVRKVLRVPFGVPAPKWLLGMGAVVIGTQTELLLKSRWVVPTRLLQQGYQFKYIRVEDALGDLLPM